MRCCSRQTAARSRRCSRRCVTLSTPAPGERSSRCFCRPACARRHRLQTRCVLPILQPLPLRAPPLRRALRLRLFRRLRLLLLAPRLLQIHLLRGLPPPRPSPARARPSLRAPRCSSSAGIARATSRCIASRRRRRPRRPLPPHADWRRRAHQRRRQPRRSLHPHRQSLLLLRSPFPPYTVFTSTAASATAAAALASAAARTSRALWRPRIA